MPNPVAPSLATRTAFSSVKLPAALVQQAKEAATPMRRSVAGQIEYWATLGRVVEYTGLTVQEAQTAIQGYEAAARKTQAKRTPRDDQGDALVARFMAVSVDGTLAHKVREVIAANQKKAARASL